jgi:hypothetical protein
MEKRLFFTIFCLTLGIGLTYATVNDKEEVVVANLLKRSKTVVISCKNAKMFPISKLAAQDISDGIYTISNVRWQICAQTKLSLKSWTTEFSKSARFLYKNELKSGDQDPFKTGIQLWEKNKICYFCYAQSISYVKTGTNFYREISAEFHPYQSKGLFAPEPDGGVIRFFQTK